MRIHRLAPFLIISAALNAFPAAADEPKPKSPAKHDRFGDPLPEGARLRLGTERFRSAGWSRAPIAMFADGDLIACFGENYLTLFDAKTGAVFNRIRCEDKSFEDMSISPDGKRIVTVGYNRPGGGVSAVGTLTVWDAQAFIDLKTVSWEERTNPERVIVLPGSKVAATAERSGVRLWDLEGAEELPRLPTTGASALAASPDGSLLAVADQRGTIHLWEWKKKIDSRRIERPDTRGAISLAFSPDGKTLAAGYDFGDAVIFFDVATGKKLRSTPSNATTSVRGLVFTRDGKHVITPDQANTIEKNWSGGIHVWDVETGKEVRYLATPGEGPTCVSLSRDGGRLAAAADGNIHVWDTKTWKELAADDTSHRSTVGGFAISKNGLILTGSDDHTARLWDLKDGRLLHKFQCRASVRNVALTADGSRAAGMDRADALLVWDIATGKTLFNLPGHTRFGSPPFFAIRDDGKRLLSFGSDLYLRITDLANGKAIVEHAIRPQGVKIDDPNDDRYRDRMMSSFIIGSGTFTPDGKLMLLQVRDEFRVIETQTTKELRRLPGSHFEAFAVSPDGQMLLTVQPQAVRDPKERVIANPKDQTVRIVKIENGEAVGSMRFKDGGIRALACSPDGKRFAVAVDKPEPRLHLCAIGDEKPLKSFKLTMTPSSALAFAPDGKSLAVGVTGGSVLVFDVPVAKDK